MARLASQSKTSEMIPTPLIFFHGSCPDGTTAAWVAWKAFGGKCECVPATHGIPLAIPQGRPVFFLDFCVERGILEEMKRAAHPYKITVLDHHETAKKWLHGEHGQSLYSDFRFDMGKSGARLAWEFFNPVERAPALVDYTEDRDLWKHVLPSTKEINAWISSFPLNDPQLWDKEVAKALHAGAESVYRISSQGGAILRFQEQAIHRSCASARLYDIPTSVEGTVTRVPGVNCSERAFLSEIAGKLAQNYPFAFCWYVDANGMTALSIRSRKEKVNVANLANFLGGLPNGAGGGGHAQAAGCQFRKLPEFLLSGYNLE